MNINQAKKELADFLKDNPELIDYQMSLNDALSKGRTPEERIQILARHITDNLQQLSVELTMLKYRLDGVLNE